MKKAHNPVCFSETKLFLFCVAISFVFITICSKNSFIYPMQDWVDSNCFFTVGKSMVNGKILYKDIIEQKGPVLYFLYSLAYYISENSFLGAYIIELTCFSFFAFISGKILILLGATKKYIYITLSILVFAITLSPAFSHGGSAEELCLFAITYMLYLLIKVLSTRAMKYGDFVVAGILFSFVFWIKYTIAFTFAGVVFAIFLYSFKEKKLRDFAKCFAVFVSAFIVSSIPVIFYFYKNNAVDDLLECYFYNNIFNYSYEKNFLLKLLIFAKNTLFTIGRNFVYGIFVVVGFIGIRKKQSDIFKSLLIVFIFTVIGTYTGGKFYKYYGLVLSVYGIFGIYYSLTTLNKIFDEKKFFLKKSVFLRKGYLLLLLPVFSYLLSGNTYLIKYDKSDLPQYIFAKQINKTENPTLLNYGFLDGGFYFASDILPTTEYFCHLNLKSEDMNIAMDEYINNGVTTFVVTRDVLLEEEFHDLKYTLVDEKSFVFENKNVNYYLYKRK